MNSGVRTKLSVMMFLQYAIWGSWAVSMGGYMKNTLGFEGFQIASIYSTTAIAAMISPLFIGYITDRFLPTQVMIGLLHLAGAILLGGAAIMPEFGLLYPIMIVYSICYMPTLALTNSISFANIGDPEKEFPGIRVWGTWGWIVAGWIVGFVLDGTSSTPIFMAAGLSAVLGLFSFMLPHTPPRSPEERSQQSGSGVLQLLRDPSFLVFVVCSFLICIPLSFYYSFGNVFLTERDAPVPTALQTIGQLSEVGFMALMPFFIVRMGVKKMLLVGMLAWVVRYFCFGTLSLPFIVFGLFLHGVCFDFFFVASQIYVDSRVIESQRASAQSFIAFVTLGVGMFIGAYVGGITFDSYPPPVQVNATVTADDGTTEIKELPLPNWDATGETGLAKELGLIADSPLEPDDLPEFFSETDEQTKITTTYTKSDLTAAIDAVDKDDSGDVTRAEWRDAQSHDWFFIWLWPALAALVTCVIFWFGFHGRIEKRVDVEEVAFPPVEP